MSDCITFNSHSTYLYKGSQSNTKIVKDYIKKQGGQVINYNLNAGCGVYFSFYVLPNNMLNKYHNFGKIFEKSIFKTISFVDIYQPGQVIRHLRDKVFSMRMIYKKEENVHSLRVVSKLPENVHKLYIKKILKDNRIDCDNSSLVVQDFNKQMRFTGFYNEKEADKKEDNKNEDDNDDNFFDLSSSSFDELDDKSDTESIDKESDEDYVPDEDELPKKKQKTK